LKNFELKKNEEGDFDIKTNKELRELFGKVDIVGVMKSDRIRLANHVWRYEVVLGIITKWKPNTNGPEGDSDNCGLIESMMTSS
jgi:hypothetical protein